MQPWKPQTADTKQNASSNTLQPMTYITTTTLESSQPELRQKIANSEIRILEKSKKLKIIETSYFPTHKNLSQAYCFTKDHNNELTQIHPKQ
jgi:hypothetical protein